MPLQSDLILNFEATFKRPFPWYAELDEDAARESWVRTGRLFRAEGVTSQNQAWEAACRRAVPVRWRRSESFRDAAGHDLGKLFTRFGISPGETVLWSIGFGLFEMRTQDVVDFFPWLRGFQDLWVLDPTGAWLVEIDHEGRCRHVRA